MTCSTERDGTEPRLFNATVVGNSLVCREHYRLVLSGASIGEGRPGQFVHLGAPGQADGLLSGGSCVQAPMLRRAFSIAGLRTRSADTCELDVIYRVVGRATQWMASLRPGDAVSVMAPLGNSFPISTSKRHAWMVGGGVGLPPMLWLAQSLREAGRDGVAFLGARSADLLALTITDASSVGVDGRRASMAAREFAESDTPVVISTDDGSLGFHGHVGAALETYFGAAGVPCDDLVVYTCGPEVMIKAVASFCMERSIECQVCMERSMACGMGTCQSCVVRVTDEAAADGWGYELCCKHGPVFDARRVIWSGDTGGGNQH